MQCLQNAWHVCLWTQSAAHLAPTLHQPPARLSVGQQCYLTAVSRQGVYMSSGASDDIELTGMAMMQAMSRQWV